MNDLHQTKNNLYLSLSFAAAVCLFCFVMHVMGNLWLINKHEWGVYPRQLSHWYGIFTSPFIHNSWGHLFANLAPLFVTLTMIFFFYRSISWAVFVMIWALTGFAVFMFARNSLHIGASGLVYGFIGFVFFSGIFRRNAKSIVLMAIVLIMYGGGYLSGMLPTQPNVSWESHLFGGLVGMWTAFVFRNFKEADENQKFDWQGKDRTRSQAYFSSDLFDKTLEQKRIEAEEEARKRALEDPFNFT